MSPKEEFAWRQLVDKCNSALADKTILELEIGQYREELKKIYKEYSDLKFEFLTKLGFEPKIPTEADIIPVDSVLVPKTAEISEKVPLPKSIKRYRNRLG